MDPHHVWKSDLDPHKIEKPGPGCGFAKSKKVGRSSVSTCKAADAGNGAIETHPGAVETHDGAQKDHRGVLGSWEGLQASHFDEEPDPDPHQSEKSDPDSDLHQSEKLDPDRTKRNADSQDWLRPAENSHMVTCAMSHQELGWLLGKFSLFAFHEKIYGRTAQQNRTEGRSMKS
jgi:hypothetical protein